MYLVAWTTFFKNVEWEIIWQPPQPCFLYLYLLRTKTFSGPIIG